MFYYHKIKNGLSKYYYNYVLLNICWDFKIIPKVSIQKLNVYEGVVQYNTVNIV